MKEKLVEYLNDQIRKNVRQALRCAESNYAHSYMVYAGALVELLDKVVAGEFEE